MEPSRGMIYRSFLQKDIELLAHRHKVLTLSQSRPFQDLWSGQREGTKRFATHITTMLLESRRRGSEYFRRRVVLPVAERKVAHT